MTLTVEARADGQRLDRFLAAHAASRTRARRQIEAGAVLVDGRAARPSQLLRAGQRVLWTPVAPPEPTVEAEEIPLVVLHEDADVIVIDKPAGLVVHPAAGHARGTLVNALLGRASLSGGSDPLRPGIVHRLDKGTSGVLVVAKSDAAHALLGEQFRAHTVERLYRAIVVGEPAARGELRTLYGRHPRRRKEFSSRVGRGKPAVTTWRVLARLAGAALVEARLGTGRTHQVRVHFADAGHPVLGDPTYGRRPRDARLREVARAVGRPALHAALLAFDHPRTGERVRFEAPLPADLARALAALRG